MSTHYEVLGVDPDADEDTIKKAYRKAARTHHPDMNGGEHSPEYLRVDEAYRVLSDPLARKDYDAELRGEPVSERRTTTTRTDDGPVYSPPADWAPAPEAKTVYVNPRTVPVWLNVLAVVGLVGSLVMHWLAVSMPGQFTILHPVVTLIVLVLAAFFLVALLVGEDKSCFGAVVALGLGWFLFSYLGSTPLAWGGTLLFFASVIVLAKWTMPSARTRPLRAQATWGSPGKSQDRTAPHTGGGAFHDGTAARATAEEFERLSDLPGVRIFHGVVLPETKAILDHVVVAGSHVVAVVSQYTDGTRGYWSDGYLHAGSNTFNPPLGDPVLQEVAAMAGAKVVMGIVSLTSPDGEVWVDNTGAPEGLFAGSTNWTTHAVRAFALEADDHYRVDLGAVHALSESVI